MKKLVLSIILIIACSSYTQAQVSGYLGKRLLVGIDLNGSISFYNVIAHTAPEDPIFIDTRYGVRLEYVLKQTSTLCGSFQGFRRKGIVGDYYYTQDMTIKGTQWQVEYRHYKHGLAPIGRYIAMGLSGYSATGTIENINHDVNNIAAVIGWGQGFIRDGIHIDIGINTNIPLTGYSEDNENADHISKRMVVSNLASFRLGVSIPLKIN